MGIKVSKFGGSSLADAAQFQKVKQILLSDGERRIVVPSAPGKRSAADTKVTDLLYECNRLAGQGKSILLFSSEFPEIRKVADRCVILYKGRINKILSREEMNEPDMMFYSTGSNLEMGHASNDPEKEGE